MKVRHTVLTCAGVLALVGCAESSAGPGPLPSCGAGGTQLSLAVAAYTSINPATDSGCVTFAANTSADTAEYLVLPWSTGGTLGGSALFRLQSATPLAAAPFASAATFSPLPTGRPATARGPVAVAFDLSLRELARSRRYGGPATSARVPGEVPQPAPAAPPVVGDKRTFKVCSKSDCTTLDTVGAVVKTVGAHIAIYVDTLAPSPQLSQTALDSIAAVFDARLYPLDTVTFGGVSDIDGNSVVIVLMTRTVNKLVPKNQCNGGFIAGFFFSGDLDPTFAAQFNNGEIFYSLVADAAGTLSCPHSTSQLEITVPVTFVHEFQHMINFVQKVRIRGGQSENTWLDEGLARYAEENAGRSFLADGDSAAFSQYAIDPVFDAYLYMRATGTSSLLIARDTGVLAPLGAGWLFTRYLVDQFGDSTPRRLVQSAQVGQANVAALTGQPFEQTVSRWALANWVSDLPGFTAPSEAQYTSWHFRRTFASLHAQDSTDFPLAYPLVPLVATPTTVSLTGKLLAGSGFYQRVLLPPGAAAFSLRFNDPSGAAVSAAVVPRLNVLRIR